MTKVSGFTIVRNAVALDFPLEASLRSILPICDEVVVNVGRSDDATRDLVGGVADPKIRIIETEWDFSRKSLMLADETQRAMQACRYPWGIYIQADEVLHEQGAAELHAEIQRSAAEPDVEGLLVRYVHFYGDMDTIAVNRRWYRREVRAVRLDAAADVRSFRDAQGFRVGPHHRKIRARLTDATMFHYGWARPAVALAAKRQANTEIWGDQRRPDQPLLPWFPGLCRFQGTHPLVARSWVDARRHDAARSVAPPTRKLSDLRYYISDGIERLTGARIFEFRNYERVR